MFRPPPSAVALRDAPEVWTLGARFARAVVERLGDPPEASGVLGEGASWALASRMSWDQLCEVVTAAERLAAGMELRELRILEAVRAAVPGLEEAARALATPARLLAFVVDALTPLVLPIWEVSLVELEPARWRITQRARPGVAPCPAFARVAIGAIRGLTLLAGRAPLLVTADLTNDGAVYEITATDAREDETYASPAAPVELELVLGRGPDGQPIKTVLAIHGGTDEAARLALARRRWALTPRLETVLVRVAKGDSNKEIAVALDCAESSVEREVTQLLKRSGHKTRAQLVAAFWIDP